MMRTIGYVFSGCLFVFLSYLASQQACHKSPPVDFQKEAIVADSNPSGQAAGFGDAAKVKALQADRLAAVHKPDEKRMARVTKAEVIVLGEVDLPVARRLEAAATPKASAPPVPDLLPQPAEPQKTIVIERDQIAASRPSVESLPTAGASASETFDTRSLNTETSGDVDETSREGRIAVGYTKADRPIPAGDWAPQSQPIPQAAVAQPAREAPEPEDDVDVMISLSKRAPGIQATMDTSRPAAAAAASQGATGSSKSALATVNGKSIRISYPSQEYASFSELAESAPPISLWSDGQLVVAGKTLEPGRYLLQPRAVFGGEWVLDLSRSEETSALAELPLTAAPADGLRRFTRSIATDKATAGRADKLDISLHPAEDRIVIAIGLGGKVYRGFLEVR